MNDGEDIADTVTVQVNGNSNDSRHQNGSGDSSPAAPTAAAAQPPNNADVPKPKRLACMICRKRKLRCDGNRPRCSTCMRLGHDCAYDEVRRKSGPKRGYVKALEERLSASTPPLCLRPAYLSIHPPTGCMLLSALSNRASALADHMEIQSKSRRCSRPRTRPPWPRPSPTMRRPSPSRRIPRSTTRRP